MHFGNKGSVIQLYVYLFKTCCVFLYALYMKKRKVDSLVNGELKLCASLS